MAEPVRLGDVLAALGFHSPDAPTARLARQEVQDAGTTRLAD